MIKFRLLDTFLQDGFYVTQNYGTNQYFDYTKYGLLFHEGVDYGHANKTKEIRCVHSGECLTAYDSAYGRYVIVLNYSLRCATWYCHLSKATIQNGQTVSAGDVIGCMGSTGNSTGPHLHLNFVLINENGIRLYQDKNKGYLDPLYPRDTGIPKKMGISYDIEWLSQTMADPLEVCMQDREKFWKERDQAITERDELTTKLVEKDSQVKALERENNNLVEQNRENLTLIEELKVGDGEFEKVKGAYKVSDFLELDTFIRELQTTISGLQNSTISYQVPEDPTVTTTMDCGNCVKKLPEYTRGELIAELLRRLREWFIKDVQ